MYINPHHNLASSRSDGVHKWREKVQSGAFLRSFILEGSESLEMDYRTKAPRRPLWLQTNIKWLEGLLLEKVWGQSPQVLTYQMGDGGRKEAEYCEKGFLLRVLLPLAIPGEVGIVSTQTSESPNNRTLLKNCFLNMIWEIYSLFSFLGRICGYHIISKRFVERQNCSYKILFYTS